MLSLVDKNPMMENDPQKSKSNNHEAVELLGLSSSDSLDSPVFSQFQAPKKRKVRFKKPFRSTSRAKVGRSSSSKNFKCEIVETLKIFSYFALLAIVGALLWYVMTLSTRIQELQAKFSDIEAGNKNTPEALHVIHSSLKQLDSNVTSLYIDVRKNIADIENITNEVKQLKDVAGNLRESIAAAPAIQQLPKDMHALSESVANFGSKMNALESNVKELKDQQSNMQTTAQNLSGELDVVKTTIQELSNSTENQAKLSSSSNGKDNKLQNTMQDASQHFDFLQGQLSNVMNSVNLLNTSLSNHLTIYKDVPSKLETVNEAIVFINNESHAQTTRLYNLENFIHANITLRIEDLELEKRHNYKEFDDYINKTVSEIILHLVNKDIFHSNSASSLSQPIVKTHDVLVLLAALLKNFNQIPENIALSDDNATEIVKAILHQAFKDISEEQISNKEIDKVIKIDEKSAAFGKTNAVITENPVPTEDSNSFNSTDVSKSGLQDLISQDPSTGI